MTGIGYVQENFEVLETAENILANDCNEIASTAREYVQYNDWNISHILNLSRL